MNELDIKHLTAAIEVAWNARLHGNHPFGAILVAGLGREILCAENSVVTGHDVTNHAETNLVRLASGMFTAQELAECTLYTSTEPCAMCSGAIHWSRIGRVVYALSEEGLYDITGPSPENLLLPCREVFRHSGKPVRVEGPCDELEAEARAVHAGFWR